MPHNLPGSIQESNRALLFLLKRQREVEGAALARLAFQPHASTLRGDDGLGGVEGEAKSLGFGIPVAGDAVELVKEVRLLFLTDTWTCISHPDDRLCGYALLWSALYPNRYRSARWTVLDSVTYQVVQHLLYAAFITHHGKGFQVRFQVDREIGSESILLDHPPRQCDKIYILLATQLE